MASLTISERYLINYAKPQLTSALKSINEAKNKANKLSIPNSFNYKTYLKSLSTNFLEVENNITKINNKIDENVFKVNVAEQKITNKTHSLTSMISETSVDKTGATKSKNVSVDKKVVSKPAVTELTFEEEVEKILKKTGSVIAKGVKSLFNGIKSLFSSAKDAWNDAVEKVKKFLKKIADKAKKTAAKVCNAVAKWCKGAWNWVANVAAPAVWDVLKKTGSFIAVTFQSLLYGVLQLVESLVDFGHIVTTAVLSIGTGFIDACQAAYGDITGKEWNSLTKAMWGEARNFVATTYVSNAYDAINNSAYGKWLNDNSFGNWAKTDGGWSQIASGIGYTVGVIVISVVTWGSATPIVLGSTAGAAALGKYTEQAWNDNKVTIYNNSNNFNLNLTNDDLIKLENGQTVSKKIEGVDNSGNKVTTAIEIVKNDDGTYSAMINGQKLFATVDKTGIVEGLSYGAINSMWEFGQWYVGGTIGASTFGKAFSGLGNVGQKIVTTGSRIVLDSVTGAVEVPFRSMVDMVYDDMTWEEAWNKNGGWNGVLSQTLIASIMSTGGEILPMDKILDKLKANAVLDKLAKNGLNLEGKLTIDNTSGLVDSAEVILQNRMDRYNQLIDIKNSDEYLNYLDNIKNGNVPSNPIFDKIDSELLSLEKQILSLSNTIKNTKTEKTIKSKVDSSEDYKYEIKTENKARKKVLNDLFKNVDGTFNNATGKQLEELFFQDDYVIGIHRTGGDLGDLIVGDGLKLTGHENVIYTIDNAKLDLNITLFDSTNENQFYNLLYQLKNGGGYKNIFSSGSDIIITSIPRSEINNLDKIISVNGSQLKLKSDYILGYVHSSNGIVSDINFNSDCIQIKNNKSLNIPGSQLKSSYEYLINDKIKRVDELNDMIKDYEQDGSLSDVQLNYIKQQRDNLKNEIAISKLALDKYNNAKIAEPNITSQLLEFEDSTSKFVGLEHRLKKPDSLSRKIQSDSIADNISYDQAANNIGDSLRYTLQIDESNYTNKVINTLKELESKGYKINKFKNFWGKDKYQGINVSIISPEGLKMELQFHTESSFYTKEVLNHKYYEIERSITATEAEKSTAIKIMKENQSKVPIPDGIIGLEWK